MFHLTASGKIASWWLTGSDIGNVENLPQLILRPNVTRIRMLDAAIAFAASRAKFKANSQLIVLSQELEAVDKLTDPGSYAKKYCAVAHLAGRVSTLAPIR